MEWRRVRWVERVTCVGEGYTELWWGERNGNTGETWDWMWTNIKVEEIGNKSMDWIYVA
jgi:hypothetical protein